MPRLGRTQELADVEALLDASSRYIDYGVRLRVLTPDNKPGRLLPGVLGGRWDRWTCSWVSPTPDDLVCDEWTIQEQQIPIIVGLGVDTHFLALLAGRQGGKTNASLMELTLDGARYPGRDSFFISLDFKASREPEEAFRAMVPSKWARWMKSDRTMVWHHGHRTIFRSAENIDSCRGPSTKTIVLDEGSRMKHEVLVAAIGCAMASKDFRLIIPTTPRRECHWLRKVEAEWPHKKGHSVLRLRTEDNPRHDPEMLEAARSEMDPDLFAQEFEGLMVPPENAVWYLFDRGVHCQREGELPSFKAVAGYAAKRRIVVDPATWDGWSTPVDVTREFTAARFHTAADNIIGWDFGKEAAVIARVYEQTRHRMLEGRARTERRQFLYVIGEAVNYRTTTEHHAHDVAAKWGTSAVVITDHMGDHERSEGRGATPAGVKILREAGFLRVIAVGPKNPDIENTIRGVLRLMLNRRGDVQFVVDDKQCPKLTEALENQKRGPTGQVEKDGKLEHVIDALRYLVWLCFPVRRDDAPRTPGVRGVKAA